MVALRAKRKPKDVETLLSQDSPLPEGCERRFFDGTGITELIDADCHDFGWYLIATGEGAPVEDLSTRGVYRLLDAPNLYYWHHPEGRAQDRLVHACELEMSRRRGDWVALEFGAHDIDEPVQLELYRFNSEIDWLKATPEDLEAFHAAQRGEEQNLVDVFGFEGNMVGIRDDVSPERTRVFFGAAVVDQNNNRFNIPVFCLGPEEGNSWPLLSDPFADDEEGVFEERVVSEGDVGIEEYEPIRFDPNDLASVMEAAAKVVALTEGDEGEPGVERDLAEYEVRVAGEPRPRGDEPRPRGDEPRRSRPHPKDLSMDDVLGEVPGRNSAPASPEPRPRGDEPRPRGDEPPRAATPATPPSPVASASSPRSEATAGMRAKVASMTLDDVLAGTRVDSRDGLDDERVEDDDEGVEIRLSLDADSDPDALRDQLNGALVDAERRLRSQEPEDEEEELLPALEGDEELEGEQDPLEDEALEDEEAETAAPDPAELERRAEALIAEALASWVPGAQVQLAFPMDGSAGAPETIQAKLKLAMQAKMEAIAQAKLAQHGDEEIGIVSRSRFVPASELAPPTSDPEVQEGEDEDEDDEDAINRRGDALIAAALANWKPGDQVRLELPMDGSAGTQGALQAKLHTAVQMKVRAASRVEEEPEDEDDVDSMLGSGQGTPSPVDDFSKAEDSALSEGQEVEHGAAQDEFDVDVDAALGDRYGDDVERFDAEPVDRGFDEEEFHFDLDAALRGGVEGSEGVQAFEDEEPEPLLWTAVEQVWHLPRLRWDRPEGAEVSLLWTAASVPPHFDRADLGALLDGTPPRGIRRFDLGELNGIVENLCAARSFVVVAVRGLDGDWQPLCPEFVDLEDGYDLELLEPEDLAQLDLAVARCVARARRIFSDTPEDLDALYAELDRARSLWRDNVRVLAFARGAGIEL